MSIKDTVLASSPDLTHIIKKAVERIGENHSLARDNEGVTMSSKEIEKDRKEWRESEIIEESLKAVADEMAEKMVLENTIDNMVKDVITEQNTEFLDEKYVKRLTDKGYKEVDSVPDGKYKEGGWGYNIELSTEDGTPTGYVLVVTNGIRGQWSGTLEMKDNKTSNADIYKIMYNEVENKVDPTLREQAYSDTKSTIKQMGGGSGFQTPQGGSDSLKKFARRQEMGEQTSKATKGKTSYEWEVERQKAIKDIRVANPDSSEEDLKWLIGQTNKIYKKLIDDAKLIERDKSDGNQENQENPEVNESTKSTIKKLVRKKLSEANNETPGIYAYNKAFKESGKENETYHKEFKKKFDEYGDFENNSHPEFPHQNNSKTDYKSPMYRGTTEDEEFVDDFAFPGLQDFDVHNQDMERLTDYLEGSSETGNAMTDSDDKALGNVVPSDLGKKVLKSKKRRKEKIAAEKASMSNLRGYTPDVQKVKQIKESITSDIDKMKKLLSYSKITQ